MFTIAEVLHNHAQAAPDWMVIIVPLLVVAMVGLAGLAARAEERRDNDDK